MYIVLENCVDPDQWLLGNNMMLAIKSLIHRVLVRITNTEVFYAQSELGLHCTGL